MVSLAPSPSLPSRYLHSSPTPRCTLTHRTRTHSRARAHAHAFHAGLFSSSAFPFFSSFFVISADRRSRRCAISVDGDDENSRDFARRATRKNAFSCDALVKAWRRPRQALAVTFQSLGCRHPVTNGAFAPRLPPIHLIHCTAQMRVLRSARHTA